MSDHHQRKTAGHPEELSRLFLERANAGDVEGLVALYEADAVLAMPDGRLARGAHDIWEAYSQILADRPTSPQAISIRP